MQVVIVGDEATPGFGDLVAAARTAAAPRMILLSRLRPRKVCRRAIRHSASGFSTGARPPMSASEPPARPPIVDPGSLARATGAARRGRLRGKDGTSDLGQADWRAGSPGVPILRGRLRPARARRWSARRRSGSTSSTSTTAPGCIRSTRPSRPAWKAPARSRRSGRASPTSRPANASPMPAADGRLRRSPRHARRSAGTRCPTRSPSRPRPP